MSRLPAIVLLGAVLGASQAWADEGQLTPRHGGSISEIGGHQVEVIFANDGVKVCVSDHDGKPIAADKITGKATVLAAGRKLDIALKADQANCVAGTGTIAENATVVVALVVDGKTVSGRFRWAK